MNTFIEKPVNKNSLSHRNLVCGVGVNDANYQVYPYINGRQVACPFYRTWTHMLERCYSDQFQKRQSTHKGCTVCVEWLTFSVFKHWMKTQDWEGMQLDKDILILNNKIYSPRTCIFVTRQINSLLNSHKAKRGKYPQGVCLHIPTNKFRAQYKDNGKVKHIGYFCTVEEAEKAYIQVKTQHVIRIANEQTDSRVRNGLLIHVEHMKCLT